MKKIINGDSVEFMKTLEDNSVDLIVTDPPYPTTKRGGTGNSGGMCKKKEFSSGKVFKYNDIKPVEYIPELYRILKEGSHCYIMTNSLNMETMLTESRKAGFKLHNILVWEKNNCTPSQFYMKNCEYTLFLRKGKAKWINNIGGSKTVHKFNNIISKKTHPCEKPTELLEFYISNSISNKDTDIVLDPFMGTGSCGIACNNLGIQNFIGIELDSEYFEIAKQRINNIY